MSYRNYTSQGIKISESFPSNTIRSKEDNAIYCTKNRERLYLRTEELKNKWLQSIQVYEKSREVEILAYKMINKEAPEIISKNI